SGMQGLFKQLKPDRFEDIIAAVALYRPGPMGAGMDKDFVERKHGRQAVSYPDPCLEKILEPTRGVIVYQEQVMQIAQVMGGYSLGGADLLRRAMGKKKAEEMEKQKAFFSEGATGKGFAQAKAEEVFDLMAFFAGYGFNKSHSAAYALIAYQTAFLKTHFPAELLCATLTADKDKIDKVVRTVNEARSMGVTVLPPDVNESEVDFTVVYAEEADASIRRRPDQPVCSRGKLRDPFSPRIRFGLGAIKGVGGAALEAILESRRGNSARGAEPEEPEEQPFVDLFDFCSRVDLRRVNKSVAEALVQCGAFDAAHEGAKVSRAGALGAVESAFERGKRMAAERASGQTSIFGLLGAEEAAEQVRIAGIFPDAEPWDLGEILAREKASLGFYVSGHPLDRYARELGRLANASTESLATLSGGQAIVIGGSVEGYRERRTKTGGDMAFFFLEDPHGRVEVIVRPRNLEGGGIRETLKGGEPILLTAKVKHEVERGNEAEDAPVEVKLLLESAQPLASVISEQTRSISVRLGVDEIDRDKLDQLRRTLEGHPGPCSVSLELIAEGWRVLFDPLGPNVDPSEALKSNVDRLFGESVCSFH
ncbi:MAG: DNA polymerase III subunit alpha, partial [Myxococcales bacterium]|nr:DNA polymerase III subunit alpha [Myxococcales bacterium]